MDITMLIMSLIRFPSRGRRHADENNYIVSGLVRGRHPVLLLAQRRLRHPHHLQLLQQVPTQHQQGTAPTSLTFTSMKPKYFPSNFQQEEGAARCYIWILFDVDWCKNLTTLPPGRADHQLRGHLHLSAGRHRHLLHPRPPRARARAARRAGRQVGRRPCIRQLPRGVDQWEHATRSRDHNPHLWLVRCWPSSTSCRSCSPSSSSWCWSRSASAPRSASSPPSPPPSTTPSRASTRSSSWKYAAS